MFRYTEKKFAKDIGRVAESIDSAFSYEYLPDSREVRLTSSRNDTDGPYTIFLGNLYLKIEALPGSERRRAIEAFLRDLLTPKELTADELLNSLGLRVRTAFEMNLRDQQIRLMGHDAPPSITRQRGDLLVEIVSDRDESVSIARSDDLAEIGVDEEEAFRIASARTRRLIDENQWAQFDESIWYSTYQDDYDFARLLAAEESVKWPFDGQPVVFSPSHSICLATSSTDPDVLSAMVAAGNEHSASHRPLSQLLWTTGSGGEWLEWQADADSNAARVARLQSLYEKIKQYEESRDHLERALGDEDVFVASFKAIENDDGLRCYSVYTFDLPSYLPRTDFVAVVDPDLPEDDVVVGQIEWADFADIVDGESMQRIDNIIPPWYRLLQPLKSEEKERIRALAKPL